MNIPNKFIVAVPASENTIDPKLMLCLAAQIRDYFGEHNTISVIATSDSDTNILKTAQHLHEALMYLKLQSNLESRNFPLADQRVSDEEVRKIITMAITPPSQVKTLVIVTERPVASKIPRVLMWDFLEEHGINPDLDMHLRPGEAGFVNCEEGTRNALHTEGYQAWAAKAMLGMLG